MDLRARFGMLVKAHRARLGLTQEALAERANISTDMVSKIESGNSGARFGVITRLAEGLGVDPAELFTADLPTGHLQRPALTEITARLAVLNDEDLLWLGDLLEVALARR